MVEQLNMLSSAGHEKQWEEAFCGDTTTDWLVNGTFGEDIGPCYRGLVFRGPPAAYAFIFCTLAWFRAGQVGAATSAIDVGAFGLLDCIRVLFVTLLAIAPLMVGVGSSPHDIADVILVAFPFAVVLLVVGEEVRQGKIESRPPNLFLFFSVIASAFELRSIIGSDEPVNSVESWCTGVTVLTVCTWLVFVCFKRDWRALRARALGLAPGSSESESLRESLLSQEEQEDANEAPFDWRVTNEGPEERAGLFSNLTFSWMEGLMRTGYRKPLDEEDLLDLRTDDKCMELGDKFYNEWEARCVKQDAKHATEAAVTPVPTSNAGAETDGATNEKKGDLKGILWALHNAGVLKPFYEAIIFKIVYDCTLFVNPQVMRLVITFLKHKDEEPLINGKLYVLLMLVTSVLQTFCLHQYFHRCFRSGMRVRSSLVTSVYKKALRLSPTARGSLTTGEIVNLMSTDCQRMQDLFPYLHVIWSSPFQVILALYFLYKELQYSVIVAVVVILFVMVPFTSFIAKKTKTIQSKVMTVKDERIKMTSEVMSSIKAIKMSGWEEAFCAQVEETRDRELKVMKSYIYLRAVSRTVWTAAPVIVTLTTFATFVLTGGVLDPATAFTSLTLLNILQFPLAVLPNIFNSAIEAAVSLRRLALFFQANELDQASFLTRVDSEDDSDDADASEKKMALSIKGNFFWDDDRTTQALYDIALDVPQGQLLIVTGEVGAGKTALLRTMIGELVPDVDVSSKVSVRGTVSYANQVPWIQNATLENNILFGNAMDTKWYKKVVNACCLKDDFAQLPLGDQTEIGERGINLSGGQKARVAMARAVYARADIIMLETVFEAVDEHVGAHLWRKAIKGLLSKPLTPGGKKPTIVLVTHALKFMKDADRLIVMKDGRFTRGGTYDELLADKESEFSRLVAKLRESQDAMAVARTRSNDALGVRMAEAAEAADAVLAAGGVVTTEEAEGKEEEDSAIAAETTAGTAAVTAGVNASANELTEQARLRAMSRVSMTSRATAMSTSSVVTNIEADKAKAKQSGGGELTGEESRLVGRVSSDVFKQYFNALGGISVVFLMLGALTLRTCFDVGRNRWLAYWSTMAQVHAQDAVNATLAVADTIVSARVLGSSLSASMEPIGHAFSPFLGSFVGAMNYNASEDEEMMLGFHSSEHGVGFYLGIYALLSLFAVLSMVITVITIALTGLIASRSMHAKLIKAMMRAPMSFFDTTPLGRVLNRFGKDIYTLDETLPSSVFSFLGTSFQVLGTIGVIAYVTPKFLLAMPIIFIGYFYVQRYYVSSSREIKRWDSVLRSPIYSHFTESLDGVTSIRAFNAQVSFALKNVEQMDRNLRAYYSSVSSNRWLAVRLEFLSTILVVAGAYFVVVGNVSSAMGGLALSYAMSVTQSLNWTIRMTSEVETNVVSVERINEYIGTKSEASLDAPDASKKPPESWPQFGKIEFRAVSARYRDGLENVVKGLSFVIQPGEKVGVVGRTGSGKSTTLLILLRIIEPSAGNVLIDNVDTHDVGLSQLRRRMAIIPQDAVMFSGTLRHNLDPLKEFTDEEVWRALERAHLAKHVRDTQAAENLENGLELTVSEGGSNWSFGQRQLISIARAVLRNCQILLMDEATSGVDSATDSDIQETVRTEFVDKTVLTIAHRIETIIHSDRVLVMDNGIAAEFDDPQTLLDDDDSLFSGLVRKLQESRV